MLHDVVQFVLVEEGLEIRHKVEQVQLFEEEVVEVGEKRIVASLDVEWLFKLNLHYLSIGVKHVVLPGEVIDQLALNQETFDW